MFREMSIGKRIGWGFAVVLVLLGAVALWSVFGIGSIVGNASEVIDGNKLRAVMVEREVDHLNWANKVTELLTNDEVTELDVQIDPHKCAFGQWYYGEERKQAEELVPQIASLLKDIEAPHAHLHESAGEIKDVFAQPHPGLALSLMHRLEEHVAWAGQVAQTLGREAGGMMTYRQTVLGAVQAAMSVIENTAQDVTLGDEAARQAAALKAVRAMRFGAGGKDYLFVIDTTPTMVMHPIQPELEGKSLKENRDPNGKALFVDMVRTCEQQGGAGFTMYEWPDPETGEVTPKLSYVALFEDWGWIVGTGVFLDRTNPALMARAREVAEGKPFSLGVQTDPTQCAFGKFLAAPETAQLRESFPELDAALTACEKPHSHLHQYAVDIEKLVTDAHTHDALDLFAQQVEPTLEEIKVHFGEAIAAENQLETGLGKANAIFAEKTAPNLAQVQALLADIRDTTAENIMTDEQMLKAAMTTRMAVVIISIVAGIVGIGLALVIVRAIIKVLRQIIEGLSQGSSQVSSAAEQVSASSQSMAEGASEQASSLEETSASLEEMASMTRQNAENAGRANSMAKEAHTAAVEGRDAMARMAEAIDKIKNSSDETAKIIKTIDEIAFQTNLLALNAAVEAARAGEAGKGFAVVAEEVRNLAQRSAQAARNTSELIAEAQNNAENGVNVTGEVREILMRIADGVEKVTGLIEEVSTASDEQAKGIDQVNTAVSQIDQVTQSNAASSEEAASASEELSAQAAELQEMVNVLVRIAGGRQGNGSANGHGALAAPGGHALPEGGRAGSYREAGRLPAPNADYGDEF